MRQGTGFRGQGSGYENKKNKPQRAQRKTSINKKIKKQKNLNHEGHEGTQAKITNPHTQMPNKIQISNVQSHPSP